MTKIRKKENNNLVSAHCIKCKLILCAIEIVAEATLEYIQADDVYTIVCLYYVANKKIKCKKCYHSKLPN